MAKKGNKSGKKGGKRGNNGTFRQTALGSNPTEVISALVNPFHPRAGQVKIPDANAAKTFTFQSRSRIQVASDANGMGYHEFYASLDDQHWGIDTVLPSPITAGYKLPSSPIINKGNAHDIAMIAGAGKRYRVVSMGIHIYSIQSPLDSQGEVIVRVMSETDTLGNSQVDKYTPEVFRTAVKNCDIVVVPPSNGEQYQTFIDFGSIPSKPNYQIIGVTMGGCKASSNILSIETVMNLEVLAGVDNIGARLATSPALHQPQLLAHVHNTRTQLPTTHNKTTFLGTLRNTIMDVAGAAGELVLGKVGGAAIRGVGRLLGGAPQQPRIANHAHYAMEIN